MLDPKKDIGKRVIINCKQDVSGPFRWENYGHKLVAVYDGKAIIESKSGRRDTFSVAYIRVIDES